MKKISPLSIIALTICFSACKETKEASDQKAEPSDKAEAACCHSDAKLPASDDFTEESIYQLDSNWKDATGKERPLKSLAGNIQVFAMGYTTCEYACPLIIADMKNIEAGLPESVRENIHFTFKNI